MELKNQKINNLNNNNSQQNIKNIHKRKYLIFSVLSFFSILLLVFTLISLNEVYACFKSSGDNKIVDIPYGSSTKKISQILNENKVIDYPFLFSTYTSFKGIKDLKYGTFNLNTSMSYDEIIAILSEDSNNINQEKFVICEGSNMFTLIDSNSNKRFISSQEIINELNNQENYSKYSFFKKLSQDELSRAYYPMEGFCAPSTFYINSESTAKSIANDILNKTDNILSNLYEDINSSGVSLWNIITIASIIEAETDNETDMKNISSVLHNRLNKGVLINDNYRILRCDPTRNYSLKVEAKMNENQNFDRIKADSYNTYKCFGLPAGPICNPSINAIKAAIYPNKTDYYYFCANLDTKEIFYATNYEDHRKNLIKSGALNY